MSPDIYSRHTSKMIRDSNFAFMPRNNIISKITHMLSYTCTYMIDCSYIYAHIMHIYMRTYICIIHICTSINYSSEHLVLNYIPVVGILKYLCTSSLKEKNLVCLECERFKNISHPKWKCISQLQNAEAATQQIARH